MWFLLRFQAKPELTISSPSLGRALWQLYTEPDAPSPDARQAWLAEVPQLAS
jgi:hypothetical protein